MVRKILEEKVCKSGRKKDVNDKKREQNLHAKYVKSERKRERDSGLNMTDGRKKMERKRRRDS
jgi:hypothetical protein